MGLLKSLGFLEGDLGTLLFPRRSWIRHSKSGFPSSKTTEFRVFGFGESGETGL